MDTIFFLEQSTNVLKLDHEECTTCEYVKNHWLTHFRWVNYHVNYICTKTSPRLFSSSLLLLIYPAHSHKLNHHFVHSLFCSAPIGCSPLTPRSKFLHLIFEALHVLISVCLFDTLTCFVTWILCFTWTGLLSRPVPYHRTYWSPSLESPFFFFFTNLNLALLWSAISSMAISLAHAILSNLSLPWSPLFILYLSYFTCVVNGEQSYVQII